MPGESIGIIGRNGAGKSTLLKILSKITPPTSGKIICRGRIAALLEVGTGFHPELTGRENIYMNGSILGMRKWEIDKHFDEIVNFSGVEKFLDTPLKRYSSGMQLRLAFAVAAHLEPEILIIDEVLAVGDAEFQKKCLGKMDEVTKSGRTVLFVSHDLGAVQNLCSKSILFEKGKVKVYDKTDIIISNYNSSINFQTFNNGIININRGLLKRITLTSKNKLVNYIEVGEPFKFEIYLNIEEFRFIDPVIGIVLKDMAGSNIIGINNKHYDSRVLECKSKNSEAIFSITFNTFNLVEGSYMLDVYIGDNFQDIESHKDCLVLQINDSTKSKFNLKPNPTYNKIFYSDISFKNI